VCYLFIISLSKKILPPGALPRFLGSFFLIIALNAYMGLSIPHINNWAHLGGFVGGLILAPFFFPKLFLRLNALVKGSE
jgi:membrane associated rhomboid family serine protease